MSDLNPTSSNAPKHVRDEGPGKSIRRILVVGVSSYIGSALATALRENFDVVGTYNKHRTRIAGVHSLQLDCMNGAACFEVVKRIQPDVVFFCPGSQEIDKIQADQANAEDLHSKGPALFFKMPVPNFHFVYFSSDQVFGNSASEMQMPPFKETDLFQSVNAYGQTKIQGESLVRSQARYTHIFRLGEVFGEPFGSGDTEQRRKTWIDSIRRRIERGERVLISTDEVRSHLYIGDLIRSMRSFLAKVGFDSTIHHLAGKDALSRFDFVKLMAQYFDLDPDLIGPVDMENDRSIRAPRPRNCSLSSDKFIKDYGYEPQTADHALAEMAERLRTGYTLDWK